MTLLSSIVLPMDPASAGLFGQLQADPKYAGIARAAQQHPKAVEVRQAPELSKQGLGGRWEMGTGSGGNDRVGLNRTGLDILAHELTHFLLGNSQFNQTMPHAKQEAVSQSFGDHGSRIQELYKGRELDEIYQALIGSSATSSGGIKELPTVGGVRSFTNVK